MRRWLWVLLGLVVAFVVLLVALVGAGAYYFRQHVAIQTTSLADVEGDLATIRSRFEGQPPLLELSLDGESVRVVNLERRATAAEGEQPRTLHLITYNVREGKRVSLSLPFWLLRLAGQGEVKLDAPGVQLDRLELSVRDLERAGSGIVLSHQDDRMRLLVWTD